jgi:hypothetical protein
MVHVQPYAAWRGLTFSKYLVVERDGDALTIQVLGIPQSQQVVKISDIARDDLTPRRMDGAAS